MVKMKNGTMVCGGTVDVGVGAMGRRGGVIGKICRCCSPPGLTGGERTQG